MTAYGEAFYSAISGGSLKSARKVLPLIMKWTSPASVVDLGCGTGDWLAVFEELGVAEVLGVDGAYVSTSQLRISQDRFLAHDLTTPLHIDRVFDLAMSVEVAEHLPEQFASQFVRSLCTLAPIVLFSAAAPGQGGTEHVNERWPEYWIAKFHEQGFVAMDVLRHRIWEEADVNWWYAQNLFLYVRQDQLARARHLQDLSGDGGLRCLPLLHPAQAMRLATPMNLGLLQLLRYIPRAMKTSLKNAWSRAT